MPFSGYAEVITSRHWKQDGTGATASAYGCKPHGEGWNVVENGFDIYWHGDGTVGRCKAPFATLAEAEAFAKDWNAKRVAAYEAAGQTAPELPAECLI